MPVHPEAQRFLDELAAHGPEPEPGSLTPEQLRRELAEGWVRTGPLAPVGDVYDRTIPGPAGDLTARVYVPEGEGPFPVLVWFHGGGWVIGSLAENDGACRAVCRLGGVVVLSVNYRLAPENPFPAAAEDAFAAVCWAAENAAEINGDGTRLAVAGESAGGNLAAVCAMKARDTGGPELALQVLVEPVLGSPADGRPSYTDFADGYFLTRASMEFFFAQYPTRPADLVNPYLLPLAAHDLSGLVPALVLTAEYDVLRDEGEEYARRLNQAGVRCDLVRYQGQIHGFFGLLDEHMTVAAAAHARVAAGLRAAFAKQAIPRW